MERNSQEPWLSEHWAASQYNFAPEIAVRPRAVQLHDITIRDGEECADIVYSTQDKIRIAEALVRAGIRRTEMFLIAPGWLETARSILQRCPQLDLYVMWQPRRVERVIEIGVRHVMVWYRIGDIWQKHVARRSRGHLMDEMLAAVTWARSAGCTVNLFLPEMTRASLEHILAAARAAEAAGATAVTVVDSQSSARPAAIGYLVRQLKAETGLQVEVHCHNDFGLAVANVLAAYEAGADALNVTVNGIGYRAGNAALADVVMALEVLYGVDTGIRLDMLPELSRLVEEITGITNSPLMPVVGRRAFAFEQWGAVTALTSAGQRQYAFPYEPEVVGRSPHLRIGKWSDEGAVIQLLAEYGLAAPADRLPHILLRCQRQSVACHRPLDDGEFLAIAEQEGARACE